MSIPFDAALKQPVGTGGVPNKATDQRTVFQKDDPLESDLARDNERANASLRGFCDEVAPQAKRYAMSIVRNWGDAEEIVQEAFCKLVESENIKSQNELTDQFQKVNKSLFFTVVRNLAIDLVRQKSRRKFEAVDQHQITDPKRENAGQLQKIESSVEAIMERLPDQWNDALKLKINGQLSYEEISQVMNATRAQVRTWIYRARKQLQKELKQQGFLEPNGGLK